MNWVKGWMRTVVVVFTIIVLDKVAWASERFAATTPVVESFEAGTLHVDSFGAAGRAIVLIPGLGCGEWVWRDTVAHFSKSYRVYVITLPGFDGRAAAQEKSLFAAFRRDFWAMLEARKVDRPVVVGHSLGGTLAIALGEDHAEKLAGIVAVDGLPVFPMVAGMTAQVREATAARMGASMAGQSAEEFLNGQRSFMSSVGTNKPELVEPAAKLLGRSDPKAVAAWMREDLSNDLRADLVKITVPLVEIAAYESADNKGLFSRTQEQVVEFYKSLLAGAPKASVVAIAPSRHFVMLDQPEALYKAIEAFLGTLPR